MTAHLGHATASLVIALFIVSQVMYTLTFAVDAYLFFLPQDWVDPNEESARAGVVLALHRAVLPRPPRTRSHDANDVFVALTARLSARTLSRHRDPERERCRDDCESPAPRASLSVSRDSRSSADERSPLERRVGLVGRASHGVLVACRKARRHPGAAAEEDAPTHLRVLYRRGDARAGQRLRHQLHRRRQLPAGRPFQGGPRSASSTTTCSRRRTSAEI